MSTINKKLLGFIFSGSVLNLAGAAWKGNVNTIYGFNSAGTSYSSFKPGSNFNSLTQLIPDGVYIADVKTLGFDIPGATLTLTGLTGNDSTGAFPVAQISAYKSWGDSITVGESASPTSLGYVPRLASQFGWAFENRAVSGKDMTFAMHDIYANSYLLPSRNYLASIGNGMNDWRLHQSAANNEYFLRMVRLFLEQCFAARYYLAGDATITYDAASGWQNQDRTGYSRSGVIKYSGSATGSLSFQVQDADNCTVVLWGVQAGYVTTSVKMLVDGVVQATVNPFDLSLDGEQNGCSVPVFLSFAKGTHTITVVNNDSNNIFFDYAVVRRSAQAVNVPALVFSVTNAADSARAGLTQAQWNALNRSVSDAVKEYNEAGYPVRWINLNLGYDPATDTQDGVHPLAAGHSKLLITILTNLLTPA